MADKEREAINEYLTRRGWLEGPDGWWHRGENFDGDYVVWDAFKRQCHVDAVEIVAALKETGRL